MSRPHTLGMVGKGFKVAGEKNGMHKLTAWQVRNARNWCAQDVSTDEAAERLHVAESTVRRAVQRKTWRRVR